MKGKAGRGETVQLKKEWSQGEFYQCVLFIEVRDFSLQQQANLTIVLCKRRNKPKHFHYLPQ